MCIRDRGYAVPGVVTGKPIEVGGSLGRGEATGRGVMLCARMLMEKLGRSLEGVTVAVQGMGNVGSVAAYLLHREGAKVVAVSDAVSYTHLDVYKRQGNGLAQLHAVHKGHTYIGDEYIRLDVLHHLQGDLPVRCLLYTSRCV